MTNLTGKLTIIRAAILALVVALVLPTAALAQGRGRGHGQNKISQQERKNEKFKNGHDARDGRWDGRGPRGDRDDWDDDDDDGDRASRRRNRDRDNDGVYDRNGIRDHALRVGYNSGYSAGRSDRARGEDYDYDDHSAYRNAGRGYNNSSGDAELYRNYFRQGFRQGYEDGYRGSSSRGGRWGDVLGDILGRP